MNVFFSIIGSLIMLTLSVGVASAGIGYLVERRTNALMRRDYLVRDDAKREVGRLMQYSHHWFSEDAGAWKAIGIIGNTLAMNADFDVSNCRDAWRREMEEIHKTDGLLIKGEHA